jgi:valyl-tRNA synthetase
MLDKGVQRTVQRAPLVNTRSCNTGAGLFDVAKELARLQKQLGRVEREHASLSARLSKPGFAAKAPEAVVAEAQAAAAEAATQMEAIRGKMRALQSRQD